MRSYSRLEQLLLEEPTTEYRGMYMQQEQDELLTVKRVATMLKVAPGTVRFWIRGKQIDAENIRPHSTRPWYRIRRSTVNTLLNQEQAIDG